MSRRYVVVGAGAVGALLAAQFELAGVSAVLVARGANLAAIRDRGVLVRRPAGDETVRVAVVSGPDELTLTEEDVLVLATKAQDVEDVLARWAWLPVEGGGLGADLPVLTLQNGLASEDAALRRFRNVYGVTVGVAASHLVPGEVVSPSFPVVGVLWLGRWPSGTDAEVNAFVADLAAAGWRAEAVADIAGYKARKLLGNVANGLDVLEGPAELKQEARAALVAEAEAVYAAAGIVPADLSFGLEIGTVPGHTPGRLSTWQSFARGASSEVDHLNGEIVLLGRRHGVPTPVNERLQRLLGAQSEAGLAPGTHTLTEVLTDVLAPSETGTLTPTR